MNDDFSSEVLKHLLDQSEGLDRSRFEETAFRNTAAKSAYKSTADAVVTYAQALAESSHPAVPDNLDAIFVRIARETTDRRIGWTGISARIPDLVWPVAAALLLGINIWQWRRADGSGWKERVSPNNMERLRSGQAAPQAATSPASTTTSPVDHERIVDTLKSEERRLAEIQKEVALLTAQRKEAAKEYQKLLQQIGASVSGGADGRLSAIALVDSSTYAAGTQKQTGGTTPMLTIPGIAPATTPQKSTTPDSGSSQGTTPNTAPDQSIVANPAPSAAAPSAASPSSPASGVSSIATEPTASPSSSAPSTSAPSTNSSSRAPSSSGDVPNGDTGGGTATNSAPSNPSTGPAASAYSVFDPSAKQGFLDMYNMPTVSANEALELWVEPVGSDIYVPVGPIPSQYYGASGGVYYKLADSNAVPAKILITVESSSAPTTPSSNVVVKGP